jgi:hypothetical protein
VRSLSCQDESGQRNRKPDNPHKREEEEEEMKSWKVSVVALVVFTIVMGGLFAGCSGGGASVQTSSTTLGQELTDLQAAYEKGLMTEKEYNKARQKIMKKYK